MNVESLKVIKVRSFVRLEDKFTTFENYQP